LMILGSAMMIPESVITTSSIQPKTGIKSGMKSIGLTAYNTDKTRITIHIHRGLVERLGLVVERRTLGSRLRSGLVLGRNSFDLMLASFNTVFRHLCEIRITVFQKYIYSLSTVFVLYYNMESALSGNGGYC